MACRYWWASQAQKHFPVMPGRVTPSFHRFAGSAAFSMEGSDAHDAAPDLVVLDTEGPGAFSEGRS